MCRGGGGLGATSPHKPAFEKTVHLSLFLSPQLPPTFPRWSFCHLFSQKALCASPRESPPAEQRVDLFFFFFFHYYFFFLLALSRLLCQTSSALTCTSYEFTSGIERAFTSTGGLVVAFEGISSWGKMQDLPPSYKSFAGSDTYRRQTPKKKRKQWSSRQCSV